MSLTLEPNAIVGGRYRLLRPLGKGGMGEVWAAEQTVTRMQTALKFLLGAQEGDASVKKRFLREARAACAVRHPNVVQIHDVIEVEGGIPAMVMELLVGESLETKLSRDGKLTPEETVAVMARVVSAVGTAHTQGVIHRDLKPDNIFLVETPDGLNVKVLDFGIAKIGSTEEGGGETGGLTATGAMLGTPYYMSPEQAFGEKRIDHRTDIWSLGIVMFRCLTGTLPTKADNVGQILKIIMTRSIPKVVDLAPQAPRELTRMVDRMLSYAPKDRPADLREVKAVLDRLATAPSADFGPAKEDPEGAPEITTPGLASTHAEPPKGRVPPAIFALGGALLLVAITVGIVVARPGAKRNNASDAVGSIAAAPSQPPTAAETQESARATANAPPGLSAQSPAAPTEAASGPVPSAAKPTASPALVGRLPQAATAPAPTAQPTSAMGGIVTQNPFQK